MKTKTTIVQLLIIFPFFFLPQFAFSQFSVNGQMLVRTEYRNGYGKLIQDTLNHSAFVSHRLRLQAGYKIKTLHLYASLQDVRTWGNTSQTKLTDGLTSLHEGFAEINKDSTWFVKVGRQELNYDNARFLGNLDWALQGRAHDFMLVKFEHKQHKLHVGGGYNQNAEALSGNIYTVPNQYKTAQMVWYNFKHNQTEISVLFWNNGKQAFTTDNSGIVTAHSMRYSQTFGISALKHSFWKNNLISGFGYIQTGKDFTNKKLSAYNVNLQTTQTITLNKAKSQNLKLTLGAELISGTKNNNAEEVSHSYTPYYGTNHAHNGYMDYFFVGGRFENSVGLNDVFLRTRMDLSKKLFLSANLHHFSANAGVYSNSSELSKELGTELDLAAGWVFMEEVSLQSGYSQMFATNTLKTMQNINNAANTQNWAYLMLIVRPKSDKKFIGLLH